jgi:hypothetical protein
MAAEEVDEAATMDTEDFRIVWLKLNCMEYHNVLAP